MKNTASATATRIATMTAVVLFQTLNTGDQFVVTGHLCEKVDATHYKFLVDVETGEAVDYSKKVNARYARATCGHVEGMPVRIAPPVVPAAQGKQTMETLQATFTSLLLAAMKHAHNTKDTQPQQALQSAYNNALDTLGEDSTLVENSTRFWGLALGSIQCAIEGNCWDTAVLFPWFAAAGFTI